MDAYCKLNVHQDEAQSTGIVRLIFKTSLCNKEEVCLDVLHCGIITVTIYEILSCLLSISTEFEVTHEH